MYYFVIQKSNISKLHKIWSTTFINSPTKMNTRTFLENVAHLKTENFHSPHLTIPQSPHWNLALLAAWRCQWTRQPKKVCETLTLHQTKSRFAPPLGERDLFAPSSIIATPVAPPPSTPPGSWSQERLVLALTPTEELSRLWRADDERCRGPGIVRRKCQLLSAAGEVHLLSTTKLGIEGE